jgi:hypothetical protein
VREVQRKFNEADRKCWERIQRDVNRGAGGDYGRSDSNDSSRGGLK